MNIIVCVDDNNGMLFNHRRQSQDRVLRQRVLNLALNSRLLMNAYSCKQFAQDADEADCAGITVSEDFLAEALPGDFCFVETDALEPVKDKIEKLIIYRWNRKYPADFRFDLNVEEGFQMTSTEEFTGSSHEKITEEIYVKAGQN